MTVIGCFVYPRPEVPFAPEAYVDTDSIKKHSQLPPLSERHPPCYAR